MLSHLQIRTVQFIGANEDFINPQHLSNKINLENLAGLLVSERGESNFIPTITPTKVNQFLGQELDLLYFDARDSFDANQFIAIIGCLRGGGLLTIRLPLCYDSFFTPLNKIKNKDWEEHISFEGSILLNRFVKFYVKEGRFEPHNPINLRRYLENKIDETVPVQPHNDFFDDQVTAVEMIIRCANGHGKRPLVMTADRGRGKSTSLALAAARLAVEHKKKIIVTAPRKANLVVFFEKLNSAIAQMETLNRTDKKILKETISIDKSSMISKLVEFIPIDQLIHQTHQGAILIVDEASSFPVHSLNKLIKKFKRFVLASTIKGYEGNGRGFELKFIPILKQAFPQYKRVHLTHPFRWQKSDPLERISNRAFLMGIPSEESNFDKPVNIKNIHFTIISKEVLKSDEDLLTSVFSLLTEAHYQTRPSDLERLLSDPSINLFIATDSNHQLVSACLVANEGNINSTHCERISSGKIRFKGHLLPQSMISTQGITQAGEFCYWRIMRIAVSPNLQNRKIGTAMIKHIIKEAKKNAVDIVGTSFAMSTELFQFWNRLGLSIIRIALKEESSTGLTPADFMMNISEKSLDLVELAKKNFSQSFVYACSSSYLNIDAQLLNIIFTRQIKLSEKSIDFALDHIEVRHFVNGARSYEMVEWKIFELLKYNQHKNEGQHQISEVLFSKVFLRKSWNEVVKKYDLKGKKESIALVRKEVKTILDSLGFK